jgi:stage II sporulation protein P
MNFGDIYKVGDTLVAGLRAKGFRVIHSYNNHNPHDAAAYHRSRRTVAELMRSRPTALVDVHRDAIPDANYYAKKVAGREIAQVRLVVGKQNANRAVNFDFAKKIKADASRVHPGLVKEIFWAKGDYNQDVSSRAILLEFGTHLNSETMARRGAALMADVLPVAISGRRTAGSSSGFSRPQGRLTRGNPSSPKLVSSQNRTGGSSALWLILVAVGGGLLFLAINAGGIGGIGRQLKKFSGQELSGFLGRYRKGGAKDREAGLEAQDKCVSVEKADRAPKDGGEGDPGR